MDASEIEQMIAGGIPGAQVEVRDYTGGGDHFEAVVISESFEGKSLVERHQAVYNHSATRCARASTPSR